MSYPPSQSCPRCHTGHKNFKIVKVCGEFFVRCGGCKLNIGDITVAYELAVSWNKLENQLKKDKIKSQLQESIDNE